jgi:hypothetical protein
MTYNSVVLADSPKFYYRLNEVSGLVATDATSNHFNGKLTGVLGYSQTGAIVNDTDTCMLFSAAGGIALPFSIGYTGFSAFSLEFWIKTIGTTWQYIVVTTNSSGTIFYLNGSVVTPGSSGASFVDQLFDQVGNLSVNGYLDEIAGYNAVLTPTQVLNHWQAVFPSVVGVTVSIAGFPVMIVEGSFEIDDQINAVSTCSLIVRDDGGTNHYHKNQPISITDSIRGLYYTGFINSVAENNIRPQTLIKSTVQCRDNHTVPERRTYQGPEYVNEYAGPIAADMLNTLAADGITAQYASRRETTQAALALGTLTNTTATTNVGDGDLELSPSGTAVTITETGSTFLTGIPANMQVVNGALCQVPFSAIKIVATNSITQAGNTYTYVKIWSGSYAIPAAPNSGFLIYDLFALASCPEIKIALDFVCTDGTTWRDNALEFDAQFQPPHPATDLSGLANNGTWYHREFGIQTFQTKTVSYVSIAVEGDKTGLYTGYVKNIYFADNSRTLTQSIFATSATALPTNQQLQNYGYSSTVVSLAQCYDPFDGRFSASYSISAAGISASTLMSWVATGTNTTTTPITVNGTYPNANGSYVVIGYSLDAGASYTICQNNAPLPDFPAGLSVAGKSIQFEQFLYSSPLNPEGSPTLQTMTLSLAPGYNGTKTDSVTFVDNNTTWALGTFTNTTNNSGPTLSLSGAIRNWDDANSSSQPLWGSSGAQIYTLNKALLLGTDTGTDVRCQNTFAPQYQNFTMEVDVLVSSSTLIGVVYRTTNWGNANDSYAYTVTVTTTGLALGHGTNSTGAGAFTSIATAAATLTSGQWHRLKVIANNTNHKVYLDDVLFINATDSTYNFAGYCGLRLYNASGSHQQAQFDNFGIVPALTGTWVSQSISLNSLGTYYSSDLYYRNMSSDFSNCTVLAEYTINGGSTWTTIPAINATLPGLTVGQSLTGVSIQFRLTLTTTTASAQPGLNSVCLKILGGFSASGTRVSANLSLANVVRLGSSLAAWNSVLPSGCTLGVDTAIDGGSWTDVTAGNGGTIPGLTVQPAPTFDTFATNTTANYTSTHGTGGGNSTWTYDTVNSRITATGGGQGLFLVNALSSIGDVDMYVDMDESDAGGMAWHYASASSYYFITVDDSSSTTTQNVITLIKMSGGVQTQLAQNAISFTRNQLHRIRVTMIGAIITVYFDGIVNTTYTDGSPLASGQVGLSNDFNTARFYQFNVQPLGQIVSSHYVQMRLRLASTNPLATPQVLDTTLSAFGNTIQVGALIPQTAYNGKYISANFDDLVKRCSATGGQWWWYIDKNKVFYLLPNAGLPAPWIASDNPGDFLDNGLTVTDQSDLYCNRVIVQNVLATTTINEARQGDSVSRSWTFGYEWASAPTILVNGNAATVGVKNVDTGKVFYYAVGDNTITIDSSVTTYTNIYIINFSGTGQYLTNATDNNTTEQTALAAIDGTSGIVEFIIDGTGLTYAAGLALAQAHNAQYSVRGKLINATTIHDGLAVGQLLSVFLPQHAIADSLFLIRSIKTHLTSGAGAGGQYQTFWYAIEAISGPDIGDWTKLYLKS